MRKIFVGFLFLIISVSCVERVPITGRKQISLIPEQEMISTSLTEYQTFLQQNKTLPATDPRDVLVRNVGNKIKDAIIQYLKQNGDAKRVDGYQWEFHAVEENTVNAWCMPGGKVVVYTGLLPVTKDEASLAIVMGHEIGHAVARHGNERMSEQIVAQGLGTTLSSATANNASLTKNLFLQAFNVGSQLTLLKYSRNQESEADKLGLVFAAIAGYDPHVALDFWKRMAASSAGKTPPEILSTHPSDETRIKDIEAFLPEAMKYYKKP